jgi:hypothetical protein
VDDGYGATLDTLATITHLGLFGGIRQKRRGLSFRR